MKRKNKKNPINRNRIQKQGMKLTICSVTVEGEFVRVRIPDFLNQSQLANLAASVMDTVFSRGVKPEEVDRELKAFGPAIEQKSLMQIFPVEEQARR